MTLLTFVLTISPNTLTSSQANNGMGLFEGLFALVSGMTILSFVIALSLPFLAFILQIVFGSITASIAGKKGYNKFGFFMYGFFFFPIAVGVAILAQPVTNMNQNVQEQKEEDEIAEYEKMYEAGTLSYTELCQKKEEIKRRKYY